MNNISTERIVVSFDWQTGSCRWPTSGCVEFKIPNAKTKISVDLFQPPPFKFTCEKFNKKTSPQLLRFTVEQIQSLTLNFASFTKVMGNVQTMYPDGHVERDYSYTREDHNIVFTPPKDFEVGAKYTLRFDSSEPWALKARLIKQGT